MLGRRARGSVDYRVFQDSVCKNCFVGTVVGDAGVVAVDYGCVAVATGDDCDDGGGIVVVDGNGHSSSDSGAVVG